MAPIIINISSLNVGMSSNLAGLSSLIHSERLDIIFLQEVRVSGGEIESFIWFSSCF